MREFAKTLARRRRELGMTQVELAQRMCVTRQTVSRWEAGAVYPDVERIPELAEILQISCDELLRSDGSAAPAASGNPVTRLLREVEGKRVKFTFYEDEEDMDLWDKECTVEAFAGGWIKVRLAVPKGDMEKLVSLASVLAVEIVE